MNFNFQLNPNFDAVYSILTPGVVLIRLFESEIDFELRHLFSHCITKGMRFDIYVA